MDLKKILLVDVVVFPGGKRRGWEDGWWKEKDWQWEFHVIPFGMEGML